MRETHKTRLIKYLKQYGSITTLQAIRDLGNTRLAATVYELKELGWKIETGSKRVNTRWVQEDGSHVKTNVGEYHLENYEIYGSN